MIRKIFWGAEGARRWTTVFFAGPLNRVGGGGAVATAVRSLEKGSMPRRGSAKRKGQ